MAGKKKAGSARAPQPGLSRAVVFIAGRRDPKTRRDKPGLEFGLADRPSSPAAPLEARAGLVNSTGLTNGRGLTNGKGLVNGRDIVSGKRQRRGAVTGRKTESALAESAGFLDSKGLTNGKGLVNGAGLTNGKGLVNGRRLMYSEAQRDRRRRLAGRTTAIFAALMSILVVFGPILYSSVFASAPITVDGDFSDWVGWPVVEETASDMSENPNINLVGVSGRASERDLFFYLQVTQAGHPFAGPPGSNLGAESFRILIDRDKSASTGYCAFGIGAEYMIDIQGYGGRIATAALKSFPPSGGSCELRSDPSFFQTAGLARSAVGGNKIEGAVRLSDLGAMRAGDTPWMLAVAQDSNGATDVGDVVFSSLPGVLVFSQTPAVPGQGYIPQSGETLLLSLGARAYHANMTLSYFTLFVDGQGGGCIVITSVRVNGLPRGSAGGSGCAGQIIQININDFVAQQFNYTDPPKSIDIYGRSTGPAGVGTVRVYLRGPGDISANAGGVVPGTVYGQGSIVAPQAFAFSYVGGLPPSVRIDGAIGDWDQLGAPDIDPDDDVGAGGGSSPGGSNGGGLVNQNIDIRATRADVNSGARTVSFYLQVDGSIMGATPLPFPSYPRPSEPSSSGGGSAATPNEDVATIYVDTDSNASSGWRRFAGLGVDAIVEVRGNSGGYGRQPRVTQTSVSTWNVATQSFPPGGSGLNVGLDSSRLETQVSFTQLCFTNCGRVRYVYTMSSGGSQGDETSVRDGTFRGGGDVLYFTEKPAATHNAFQGDRDVPLLVFSIAAPSTNAVSASINDIGARLQGVTAKEITALAIYRDRGVAGQWDAEDLAVAPVAEGTLSASGLAVLHGWGSIDLAPGERFDAILVADIGWDAAPDSYLTTSIGAERGVYSTGVPDVIYDYQAQPAPVRIFEYMGPGPRASTNLRLNEINFNGDWVEIFDTTGSSISLTSPQIYLILRHVDEDADPPEIVIDANVSFSGSTNSEGFATADVSALTFSTGSLTYTLLLRCNNCSGTGSHTTLDSTTVPAQGDVARGAWGRYSPDGTGSWQSTDNNTQADNNTIPEFQDIVVPALGVMLLMIGNGWRRRAKGPNASEGPPETA